MRFSIVIATYKRAALLKDTLDSLSHLTPRATWEVIVVDNNSPDDTREIVEAAIPAFPVPLRYVFEKEQGRSAALNCGFRIAEGEIVVTTDDDVRVEPDWLDHIEFGLATKQCDYVGGRVIPMWESEPPRWIPRTNGRMWAVIALLDYGPEPIRFGARVPLGVNMAMRREAIERVGGFNTSIGRKAGTLLGQEVRDWCMRAHAAGLVGYYLPTMVVRHHIPTDRMNKKYFRSWFYWRGISRAMMYARTGKDMEAPEQTQLDFSKVAHVAGVPRYLFRNAFVAVCDVIASTVRRDAVNAFERELWLWMFAGIVKQRWHDRQQPLVMPQRATDLQ
jgi:glycosyltransferase involved in cell wall biosynthesis